MKKILLFLLMLVSSINILAQTTAIPDDNFEQALIDLGYDSGTLDNSVPTANINTIISLDVSNKNILDLTGIEDFTALQLLGCSNNQLTNVDLSLNTALTGVFFSNNQLVILNLKNGNTSNFDDIDTNNNPNLLCIEVDDAAYAAANLSDNIDAQTSYNEDCSGLQTFVPDDNFEQALIDFGYDSGALDDFVPTANINTITSLNVFNKNIADLTGIEDFVALTNLNCGSNELTSLDVSQNVLLNQLACHQNQLTSLDVTQNTALITLSFNFNQLNSINLINNVNLSSLFCRNSSLTILDLSQQTLLTNLSCHFNQITTLDLSQNTVLSFLNCQGNQLTSLNVKNGNNTSIINANFNATSNPSLICIDVDDAAYSTANWTNIDTQTNFNENCSTLGIEDMLVNTEKLIITNYNDTSIKVKTKNGSIVKNFRAYDILGKLILNKKPNQSEFFIDTQYSGHGTILFIKVELENAYVLYKKFLKI